MVYCTKQSTNKPASENANKTAAPAFSDQRASTQLQLKQQSMMRENNRIVQRVPSVSGVQYIPTAADMMFINALDGQVAVSETAASNDVRNNPAPAIHTPHQAAYMRRPSAAGWGNCVEEKLNVWAVNNGWSIQNVGGGSNPDYSRVNGVTTIWADLTTAAEAGAGAEHISEKLNRKRDAGMDDSNWVAADVVHQGLSPLAGMPPVPVATNGIVSVQQQYAWQLYARHMLGNDYDDMMQRRINAAQNILRVPSSYATYTQSLNNAERERFRKWIDGTYDRFLPDEYSDDEYDRPPPRKKRKIT